MVSRPMALEPEYIIFRCDRVYFVRRRVSGDHGRVASQVGVVTGREHDLGYQIYQVSRRLEWRFDVVHIEETCAKHMDNVLLLRVPIL